MTANRRLSWVALFFSSVFFLGFLPGKIHPRLKGKGGGLMGSLVAFGFLCLLWGEDTFTTNDMMLVAALSAAPIGMWVVRRGEALMFSKWGPRRRHTGQMVNHDYNETCWDEVVGMFWAAQFIWSHRGTPNSWLDYWPLLAILVLFRILDTAKPWPISWIEGYFDGHHNDLAVILDDVVAGIIAGIPIAIVMKLMA